MITLDIEKDNIKNSERTLIYLELRRRQKLELLAKIAEDRFFDLILSESCDIIDSTTEKEAWQVGDQEPPKPLNYRKLAKKAVKIANIFVDELYKTLDKLEKTL